jgi:hypothetical protein
MTTTALEPGRGARARRTAFTALSATLHVFGGVARAKSRATRRHLQDHAYSICGFGLISGAAFVHSLFTGLLVAGVCFLVFEWKVSE